MAATIAKVSAQGAKKYYYEKDPIFNSDGEGQNLEWSGKQAEFLGLEGAATKEEFGNLLEGKNKTGDVQLKEEKNKVAAYDLTFAAPKSVSILALNGDEKLVEAHKKAVDKALQYAEKNFANAKVWKKDENGQKTRIIENQGNLLIAKAMHSTNRNQDPHLHTHSLIFNQVFVKEEGKFKALAAQELFQNQKTLDNIYKSELAKEVQKLGYKLEKQEGGGWEIAIKDDLKEEFSSRRREILEKAEETGATTVKEKVHIQHMFKKDKKDISGEKLLKNWENTINKHYNSKEEMFQEAKGYKKVIDQDGKEKLVKEEREQQFSSVMEVLEYTGKLLSENEAVWSRGELLTAASDIATGEFTMLELEEALSNVKKIGQKEGYELKKLDAMHYTNKEMHDLEKENINLLKNQKEFGALMSAEDAKEALQKFEENFFKLNEGQYNTVFNLLTSGDQFQAIQGVAGAGKTTMLKAFNYALNYKNNNVDVTLLAPTNKAASGAAVESKIDDKAFNAQTVAKHIINIQKEEGTLGKKDKNEETTYVKSSNNTVVRQNQNKTDLSASSFTAKNNKDNKALTEAELYAKSGHSAFNKDSKTFLLNAANNFGIKLNKNLEGVYIAKGRNRITKQTKINRGEFAGAIKKEEMKFRGDSISYRSNIKFKDGSEYRMSVENWNGANKLMSALFNVKTTNIQDTRRGERLKQTQVNLTALKLTRKAVNKQNAQQRKLELNLAGLAKASVNKTSFKLKNGLEKTQTTKSFGVLGFNITTIREELKNKEGNVISLRTQKEKSFLGFTLKRETEVKNIRSDKADLKIKNEITEQKISQEFQKDNKDNKNEKTIEEKSTKEFKDIDKEKALKIASDNAKIQKSEKMIIIDEASMLSARDLNKILKDANQKGYRVVLMGDTRQLQSIGAGRAFEQAQKYIKVSTMNESLRQHTKTEKTIADSARDAQTIVNTFKELEQNNRVHRFEITEEEIAKISQAAEGDSDKFTAMIKSLAEEKKEEMLKAAAKAAVKEETLKGTKFGKEYEKKVDYKDNLLLANTRKEVESLNNYVREELKDKGILKEEETINVKVVKQVNLSAIKQANASNFNKNQIIQTFHTNQSQMKIGKEYEIVGIDKIKNTLTLKELNAKDDKTIEVNVKELAGKFAIQEKEDLEIAVNDIVVVTKTDKQQDINNSDRGIVVDVDKERQKIKVDFGEKGVKEIDLSKGNVGLAHGYAMTTYKAQGVSVDRVQAIVTQKFGDAEKINNLNSFYVAASRQKLKMELYTNGYDKIKEEVNKLQEKTSTLDFTKTTQDMQKQHTQNLNNLIKQASSNTKEGINTQTAQKLEKLAQNAQKEQSAKNPEIQAKIGFETENRQNQKNTEQQQKQAKNAEIQAF